MANTEITGKKGNFTIYGVVAVIIILAILLALFGSGNGPGGKTAQARDNISQIDKASQAYRAEYGALPRTPDSERLLRILAGNNPRKIVFLVLNPGNINLDGKYVDPWGTPYEIIVDSDFNLHITSAGPDKNFDTADDIKNR